MNKKGISGFRRKIWRYYRTGERDFLWRRTRNPYRIFVSEVMLQQTQVGRVSEKYPLFVEAFPSFASLSRAPLGNVIRVWRGLGYNRRALFLKRTAEVVTKKYGGKLPKTPEELVQLPGIGKATAASIAAFAFERPAPFIETNIRRVFIHEFFPRTKVISDAEILPLVLKTLDRKNPREWFYALMDYGAHLAKTIPNPNRKSRHYNRQSKFEGSRRQLRGKIVALLTSEARLSVPIIVAKLRVPSTKARTALFGLVREGIVQNKNGKFMLAE